MNHQLYPRHAALKNLRAKFKKNETRMSHKPRLKNAIDFALLDKKGITIPQLLKALQKEGIIAVLRKNKEGLIYGITYVDHQTKCVLMAVLWETI